jgi:DNA-binding NarL/FixJ family response regulator
VCTRFAGLRLLEKPAVDVLLVDIGLPDGSGIDVIAAAKRHWPACAIMVNTTFADEAHVMASIEAGAVGYLLKDCSRQTMIKEIRNLQDGGSPISPLIARQILMRFRGAIEPAPAAQTVPTPQPEQVRLSTREAEVLAYITKGFTAQEIADLLQISQHTVLTFIRRIYTKLNVRSRTEAIYEARQQGLLAD